MARIFREDFDREREFVAARSFTLNGVKLSPGQPIDKSACSVRRLRQLYDLRQIDFVPTPLEQFEDEWNLKPVNDKAVVQPAKPEPRSQSRRYRTKKAS